MTDQEPTLQESADACAGKEEPCIHHWVSRCHQGLSATSCSLCGSPDWDELARDKYDRDRLWRCLWDAQTKWMHEYGKPHAGWQVALEHAGPPT